MNDTQEKINIFEKEICRYCKNDQCGKGIVVVLYDNQLQMKCFNYISNKNNINKEIEVIKKFERKKKI